MHLHWFRISLAGLSLAWFALTFATNASAQAAAPPQPTQSAPPPGMGPPPLDPAVQRYLAVSGLDLLRLQPGMLTNIDPDLGPMRNRDICDLADERFASYRSRRADFDLGKQQLEAQLGPEAFRALGRLAYEEVLPSIMTQKSCQSGEIHFNSDEFLPERLSPAEAAAGRSCKLLRVPGWLVQAVLDSRRDLKAVDLVCLDVEMMFIYGKKLDYFRIAGSRVGNFIMRFSEITSGFIVTSSTVDNDFEVRWNTFNDIYLDRMTTMSRSGREFFGIQNNKVGNGIEINDLEFGVKPDESNEQHGVPMFVSSNRVGSDLAILNSRINGPLNLFDTTATAIRVENSTVAGFTYVDSASAEKGIFFRGVIAGGGVQGHYLHADGMEFRAFSSVANIDIRSSQFADKLFFGDVIVDQVLLHDVVTRPLLIFDTKAGNFEMEGLKADLVLCSSNGTFLNGSRMGWLSINDSNIENTVQIDRTVIERRLGITETQIGSSLALEGDRTIFQDTGELDIRGMKTDGLNIEPAVLKTFDRNGVRDTPLSIKSNGAVFNRFGSSSETGEDLSDLSVPELLCHFSLMSQDTENSEDAENKVPDPDAPKPCKASNSASARVGASQPDTGGGASPPSTKADGEEDKKSNYRAEEFDQLAAALERSGRGDKARDIKIAKNRAYADASNSALTRAIYTIAGFVNGYGYNNQFALMLYFACVLVGMFLFWLWLNAHPIALTARMARSPDALWGKRKLLSRIGLLRRKRLPPEESRSLGVYRRNGGLIYAFFFSLDRSLPPLNLDSAFATHEGMWRPLAYWFFFQRAFCFLVISLVLAGSLGMFQ